MPCRPGILQIGNHCGLIGYGTAVADLLSACFESGRSSFVHAEMKDIVFFLTLLFQFYYIRFQCYPSWFITRDRLFWFTVIQGILYTFGRIGRTVSSAACFTAGHLMPERTNRPASIEKEPFRTSERLFRTTETYSARTAAALFPVESL